MTIEHLSRAVSTFIPFKSPSDMVMNNPTSSAIRIGFAFGLQPYADVIILHLI